MLTNVNSPGNASRLIIFGTMKAHQFKLIGIAMALIILLTAVVQAVYIYQDYEQNKRQFKNEVQESLDNSVEHYFAEIAKSDVVTFTGITQVEAEIDKKGNSTVTVKKDTGGTPFFKRMMNSMLYKKGIRLLDNRDSVKKAADSLHISSIEVASQLSDTVDYKNGIAMYMGQKAADSISSLKKLAGQIIVSLTRDTIDFDVMNQYLQTELERKGMDFNYALIHYEGDSITGQFNTDEVSLPFNTFSRSTFLPDRQRLEMRFENAALLILRKGIGNILFSLFFLLLISGVLWYLYRVIRIQKELSEIKNDLINNITHEFKTPIATISTALEAIQHFNTANDWHKTSRYMDISSSQLIKLNLMVEKLLETATLDSAKLVLNKEDADLKSLLSNLMEKYQTLEHNKQIKLIADCEGPVSIDVFHMENALSNLIDNAIKYGGDIITIALKKNGQYIVTVTDDGGNIPKDQKAKVFEKFYRIPRGNVHDVKGFGIGLYYTKNIIEKHDGRIILEATDAHTTFKVILP